MVDNGLIHCDSEVSIPPPRESCRFRYIVGRLKY